MLTLALLLAWCTPRPSGYTPFEILSGRVPPVIRKLKGSPQQPATKCPDTSRPWEKSSTVLPEKP